MTHALWISNLLLWLGLVTLGLLLFALTRQIGVLSERIAPAGALQVQGALEIGAPAPELDVTTWSGAPRHLGAAHPRGAHLLILFVSPRCPLCAALLPLLGKLCAEQPDACDWLLASDGPAEEHARFIREKQLDPDRYLVSAELGMRYAAARLPHAVLIDREGVLRAHGLVNSREHLESLFEAMRRRVASLQEHLQQRSGEPRG